MKATKCIAGAWALGFIFLSIAGCADRPPDMIRAGQLSLEKSGIVGVHLMWAEVRQVGDLAVVTGTLTPRGASLKQNLGHIYIEFFDSTGTLIAKAHSKPFWVNVPRADSGSWLVRFRVESQTIVPVGGKVLVSFRRGLPAIGPDINAAY